MQNYQPVVNFSRDEMSIAMTQFFYRWQNIAKQVTFCTIFGMMILMGLMLPRFANAQAQPPGEVQPQADAKPTADGNSVPANNTAGGNSAPSPSPAAPAASSAEVDTSSASNPQEELLILKRIQHDLWDCLQNARFFYSIEERNALQALKIHHVNKIITSEDFKDIVLILSEAENFKVLGKPYAAIQFMLAELFGYFGDVAAAQGHLSEIEQRFQPDPEKPIANVTININHETLGIAEALKKARMHLSTMTENFEDKE